MNDMDAELTGMTTFVQALNPADHPKPGVLVAVPLAWAGMPESAPLCGELEELGTSTKEFLTAAESGVTSYKSLVMECHNAYVNKDEELAKRLAETAHRREIEGHPLTWKDEETGKVIPFSIYDPD